MKRQVVATLAVITGVLISATDASAQKVKAFRDSVINARKAKAEVAQKRTDSLAAARSLKGKPFSDRFSIVVHTVALPIADQPGYYGADGNFNPYKKQSLGIGAEYQLNKYQHLAAGGYQNPLGGVTVYGMAGIESNRKKLFGAGAEGGLKCDFGKAVEWQGPYPFLVPFVRVGKEAFNVKAYVRTAGPGIPPTVGISARARLSLFSSNKQH